MLLILRLPLLAIHCALACIFGLLLCLCRPFNPDNSRLCAALLGRPALWIMGIRVKLDLETLHALQRPCVIVANHQSNYDLFIIGGHITKRTVSMGKKSLKWIPVFGQLYWLAGNILVDRDNPRAAVRALKSTSEIIQKKNTSIFVFPEGTRNPKPGLLPFKKGAFQLASGASAPIVPLCVSSYAGKVNANRWIAVEVEIKSLPAIETHGIRNAELPALIEDCRQQMLTQIELMDQQMAARS